MHFVQKDLFSSKTGHKKPWDFSHGFYVFSNNAYLFSSSMALAWAAANELQLQLDISFRVS